MLSINKCRESANKFVLLLITVLTVSCGDADDTEYVERAKDYLKSRDLNAATLELKNALRQNAQYAEARYLLGKIKLEIGDAATAEKEMRRAIDAGWDEAEATLLLAEALLRQGKFKEVIEGIQVKDMYPKMTQAGLLGLRSAAYSSLGQWEDAIESVNSGESLSQDALWWLQSKARIAIYQQDFAAVKETLVKALLVYPENKDLWLLSAGLSVEENDNVAANAALQKVIDLEPPKIMTAWGRQARLAQFRIFFKQQDLVNAKKAIDPVLKRFTGDPETNYLGGLLAFSQGQYDLAEERLLVVLQANPEHREGQLLFGQLNYVQKDFQQAAHYLEKATSTQPGNTTAQALLGKTYLMLGQYGDAEKKFLLASSQSAENAELLALVGVAKIKAGDANAGIEQLQKAATIAPADAGISSKLANAYLASGDTSSAIQTLERAIEHGDKDQQFKSMLLLTYVRTGDIDKALVLANEIVALHPEHALAYNLRGVVYEGEGNIVAAGENYHTALSLDANNSMAQLSLARIEMSQGQSKQAAKRYRAVLEKQPDNAAALVAMAKLSAREGQEKQALELLEKARSANPLALEARLILANYYLIRGDAKTSLLIAKEAVDATPHSPAALLAVGRAQLIADTPEALRTLSNLVAYAPSYAEAHYYLAQAEALSGDLAGARESLQQAVKLTPDYVQAQLLLARIDLNAGKPDVALKVARKIQKQHPNNAEVYILLGDSLMAQKDTSAALSSYQQALKHTNKSEAVLRINKLYQLQGKTAAGIQALQAWLKQHTEDFSARFVLAITYLGNGENEKAYAEYQYLNEKHPDNAAVLNDLAWLKYEKGEADALIMAERAHRLAPNNPAIQDTYGWILLNTGRVESGLAALRQASAKLPDNFDIRYHYSAALAQAGEKVKARKELDAMLNSGKLFSEREKAQLLRNQL